MALVRCIECKKEISSSAEECPHCGKSNPTQSIFKRAVFAGFFIAIGIGLMFYFRTVPL